MYVDFSWGEGGLYIGYNEFHDESKILAKELVIEFGLIPSYIYFTATINTTVFSSGFFATDLGTSTS